MPCGKLRCINLQDRCPKLVVSSNRMRPTALHFVPHWRISISPWRRRRYQHRECFSTGPRTIFPNTRARRAKAGAFKQGEDDGHDAYELPFQREPILSGDHGKDFSNINSGVVIGCICSHLEASFEDTVFWYPHHNRRTIPITGGSRYGEGGSIGILTPTKITR